MQYIQEKKENDQKKENAQAEYSTYRRKSSTALNERTIIREEKLTGYVPSEQELMDKNNPREVKRIENTFGVVAFGKNKKKEMVMTVAGKGNHRPTLPNSTKELDSSSAVRLNYLTDHFFANSHDREESALAYKVSYQRSPRVMLARLKNMVAKKDVLLEENLLPFLREKEMKEQKKQLNELLRTCVETKDQEESEIFQQKVQEAQANLEHREREEKRFLKQLETSVELMRKEATTDDFIFFSQKRKNINNPSASEEDGDELGKPMDDNSEENAGDSFLKAINPRMGDQ